jgi:hypothetical protein
MKFDLSQNSGAKIAIIVIVLYAVIAAVTFFAWNK